MESIPLPLAITLLACTAASYMNEEQLELAAIAFKQLSDTFNTLSQLRAVCDSTEESIAQDVETS